MKIIRQIDRDNQGSFFGWSWEWVFLEERSLLIEKPIDTQNQKKFTSYNYEIQI